jgi:hypothetical protein
MSKQKVRITEPVRGSTVERLFWFCAFSEHALIYDYEEDNLEKLIKQIEHIQRNEKHVVALCKKAKLERDHEEKKKLLWAISELLLSQILKTNKIEEIQFENVCLSTLPKSNSKLLQKRDIIDLDIPKNFPRIYEFSKYSSVECINFDNKYEKEKNELQNSESTEMESIVHRLESKIKKEKEFGELMETRLKKSQKFLEETENFIKNHPNEKLTLPEMNIEKFFKRRVPK